MQNILILYGCTSSRQIHNQRPRLIPLTTEMPECDISKRVPRKIYFTIQSPLLEAIKQGEDRGELKLHLPLQWRQPLSHPPTTASTSTSTSTPPNPPHLAASASPPPPPRRASRTRQPPTTRTSRRPRRRPPPPSSPPRRPPSRRAAPTASPAPSLLPTLPDTADGGLAARPRWRTTPSCGARSRGGARWPGRCLWRRSEAGRWAADLHQEPHLPDGAVRGPRRRRGRRHAARPPRARAPVVQRAGARVHRGVRPRRPSQVRMQL